MKEDKKSIPQRRVCLQEKDQNEKKYKFSFLILNGDEKMEDNGNWINQALSQKRRGLFSLMQILMLFLKVLIFEFILDELRRMRSHGTGLSSSSNLNLTDSIKRRVDAERRIGSGNLLCSNKSLICFILIGFLAQLQINPFSLPLQNEILLLFLSSHISLILNIKSIIVLKVLQPWHTGLAKAKPSLVGMCLAIGQAHFRVRQNCLFKYAGACKISGNLTCVSISIFGSAKIRLPCCSASSSNMNLCIQALCVFREGNINWLDRTTSRKPQVEKPAFISTKFLSATLELVGCSQDLQELNSLLLPFLCSLSCYLLVKLSPWLSCLVFTSIMDSGQSKADSYIHIRYTCPNENELLSHLATQGNKFLNTSGFLPDVGKKKRIHTEYTMILFELSLFCSHGQNDLDISGIIDSFPESFGIFDDILLTGECTKLQRLKIIPPLGKPLESPRGG
ncbi:hypothetical protein VP01_233g2 [Puccinia sorghi]|uniref:Uncharacterized protein n=1 Tax=Puccinia sorghi TaxID=27349 RepID=A0A0L6V7F9_9BASI|nr:hypothetical protein VP01_233g2 [Puccinia sorghi]